MTKVCPKCGTHNSDDALFCYRCGNPLPIEASTSQKQTGASFSTDQQGAAPKEPIATTSAKGHTDRLLRGIILGLILGVIIAGVPAIYYYQMNSNLLSILNLNKVETLVNQQTISQGPGGSYSFKFNLPYAGYIIISVSSSTSSKTFVEIAGTFDSNWSFYSGKYNVGYSGTVYFPVVPGTVYVYIGNDNYFSGATETVTIKYVY